MDDPITQAHDQRYMHALLQALHTELERSGSLSEDERALLIHVKADVDGFLERESPEAEHDESLGAWLQEGIAAFEASHPELTGAMQRVLDSLSQAGI